MKQRKMQAAIGLTILVFSISVKAEDPCVGVPGPVCSSFLEALELREQRRYEDSLTKFDTLRAKYPNSFPIQYAYGRLLAQMQRYAEAVHYLEGALNLGQQAEGFEPAAYNTFGFTLLMDARYEEALEAFQTLETSKEFSEQSTDLKMKVYNNSGVAYMQLDRYEEAKKQFEKARDLGSQLALKNLAKIASILETLKASDINVPGVFAVIVASAKTDWTARQELSQISQQLNVPASELAVFIAANGRYLIARASQVSYPKAEQLTELSKKEGVSDAFIASTTDWEDVTKELNAGIK